MNSLSPSEQPVDWKFSSAVKEKQKIRREEHEIKFPARGILRDKWEFEDIDFEVNGAEHNDHETERRKGRQKSENEGEAAEWFGNGKNFQNRQHARRHLFRGCYIPQAPFRDPMNEENETDNDA